MSYQEFMAWEKFLILEPVLPERVDLAGALIASLIANVNRSKGKPAFKIDDFMVVKARLDQEARDNQPDAPREEVHFFLTMNSLQKAFADA